MRFPVCTVREEEDLVTQSSLVMEQCQRLLASPTLASPRLASPRHFVSCLLIPQSGFIQRNGRTNERMDERTNERTITRSGSDRRLVSHNATCCGSSRRSAFVRSSSVCNASRPDSEKFDWTDKCCPVRCNCCCRPFFKILFYPSLPA